MIINLYIDGDKAELLEALADYDEMTIEDKANEMFSDLMAKTLQSIKEEFFN